MLTKYQKKLVADNVNFAEKIAYKRWEGVKEKYELDEVKHFSYLGLIKASKAYDPNKNVKFNTFATKSINWAITHEILQDKRYYIRKGGKYIPRELNFVSLNNNCKAEASKREDTYIDIIGNKCNELEQLTSIYSIMQMLTTEERKIVKLLYIDDLTQAEAAKELNTYQSTLNRKKKEILRKLRKELENESF